MAEQTGKEEVGEDAVRTEQRLLSEANTALDEADANAGWLRHEIKVLRSMLGSATRTIGENVEDVVKRCVSCDDLKQQLEAVRTELGAQRDRADTNATEVHMVWEAMCSHARVEARRVEARRVDGRSEAKGESRTKTTVRIPHICKACEGIGYIVSGLQCIPCSGTGVLWEKHKTAVAAHDNDYNTSK